MKLSSEQFYFLISATCSRLIRAIKGNKTTKSILVVKWDEIGDMVYALHVFKHLKTLYPGVPITVYCKNFTKSLLQNNPFIDTIIHELPNERFDLLIELRGNWNTLKYALNFTPNRRFDRGEVRILNKWKGQQKHEVETNFQIIEPIIGKDSNRHLPQILIERESVAKINEFSKINSLDRFALIHCVARRKLRQWSIENFALIINELSFKYNLKIVLAGTIEDEPEIDQLASLCKTPVVKFTQGFSLVDFAELAGRAKIFIGNESGPLHIAAVMETPLIGLYGPGVKDVFYPIGIKSHVLHNILSCNPCDQIHCVRPESPCINLINFREVSILAEKILTKWNNEN